MSKYTDSALDKYAIADIQVLLTKLPDISDNLHSLGFDHICLFDEDGNIMGKIAKNEFVDGGWEFKPRRHDKPGTRPLE